MIRKLTALTLICLLLTFHFDVANSDMHENKIQLQAIADARQDVNQDIGSRGWFFAGCCGIFVGYALAHLKVPTVPTERLIGKSPEYIAFYVEEYKDAGKKRQVKYAKRGWGVTGCVFLTLYALAEVNRVNSGANSSN